jgi:hypothetical protein
MRTRITALGIAGVAALALAAPVGASAATPISVTLDVNFGTGVEVITDQTNFCEGSAQSTAWISGGGRNGGGTLVFHVGKVFTCTDGSGTLSIELNAPNNRGQGGTTGGWTVVGGTGDYAGARGGGSIMGAGTQTGILDQYEGTIVR